MSKTRSSTKGSPLDPVFFVDADLSDHIFLGILREANIRFERHDDHFAKGTDDLDWMVKAGQNEWVVLSHNKRIRTAQGVTEAIGESSLPPLYGSTPMSDLPELTDQQFARALPARVRRRLMQGQIESGEDVAALRRFVGLTQVQFALAMGISVQTLRNWEQGRRHPQGPAIALLRIAARHPRIIRENIEPEPVE